MVAYLPIQIPVSFSLHPYYPTGVWHKPDSELRAVTNRRRKKKKDSSQKSITYKKPARFDIVFFPITCSPVQWRPSNGRCPTGRHDVVRYGTAVTVCEHEEACKSRHCHHVILQLCREHWWCSWGKNCFTPLNKKGQTKDGRFLIQHGSTKSSHYTVVDYFAVKPCGLHEEVLIPEDCHSVTGSTTTCNTQPASNVDTQNFSLVL